MSDWNLKFPIVTTERPPLAIESSSGRERIKKSNNQSTSIIFNIWLILATCITSRTWYTHEAHHLLCGTREKEERFFTNNICGCCGQQKSSADSAPALSRWERQENRYFLYRLSSVFSSPLSVHKHRLSQRVHSSLFILRNWIGVAVLWWLLQNWNLICMRFAHWRAGPPLRLNMKHFFSLSCCFTPPIKFANRRVGWFLTVVAMLMLNVVNYVNPIHKTMLMIHHNPPTNGVACSASWNEAQSNSRVWKQRVLSWRIHSADWMWCKLLVDCLCLFQKYTRRERDDLRDDGLLEMPGRINFIIANKSLINIRNKPSTTRRDINWMLNPDENRSRVFCFFFGWWTSIYNVRVLCFPVLRFNINFLSRTFDIGGGRRGSRCRACLHV